MVEEADGTFFTQREEASHLQAVVHLGTCTAGDMPEEQQRDHKQSTSLVQCTADKFQTQVCYTFYRYISSKRKTIGNVSLPILGLGIGQSTQCIFFLNKTCLQEFQTSGKVWSEQDLASVVEDQCKEHLNKLGMCRSTESGGMHA